MHTITTFKKTEIFLQTKSQQAITGRAAALHCCKAHAKINRKIENLTAVK